MGKSLLFALAFAAAPWAAASPPNIIYILADDLGYGDVHCLGGERSKIATPRIDRLAGEGMTFTETHASSAVCTPSRYSILTGRYNWRSILQKSVLWGFSPPLIAAGRLTVAGLLKEQHKSDIQELSDARELLASRGVTLTSEDVSSILEFPILNIYGSTTSTYEFSGSSFSGNDSASMVCPESSPPKVISAVATRLRSLCSML